MAGFRYAAAVYDGHLVTIYIFVRTVDFIETCSSIGGKRAPPLKFPPNPQCNNLRFREFSALIGLFMKIFEDLRNMVEIASKNKIRGLYM
jgi:hypothetical protein